MKKGTGKGEGGAFLLVEAIRFSKDYYMMLDIAFIEIITVDCSVSN